MVPTGAKNTIVADYICWTLFSAVSGFYLILPLYFFNSFHMSHLQATSIVAMYTSGLAIGAISYNQIVRLIIKNFKFKFHMERLFLSFSGILVAILLIFFLNASAYIYKTFLIFIIGIISSCFSPLNMSIMNKNTHDKDNAKHAGLQRWTQNLGLTLLFVLFAYWRNFGVHLLYVFSGILLLGSTIEFLICLKLPVSNDASENKVTSNKNGKLIFDANLKLFFVLVFFSLAIFMQIPNLYAYYLHDKFGITYTVYAKLMFINAAIVILLQMPISKHIIKRFGFVPSQIIGLILVGIGIAIPLWHSYIAVVLSFIVWTLGEILMFTAIRAQLMRFSTNVTERNVSLSVIYYMIFYLSNLTCPLIIKFLYGRISHDLIMILVCALSIIIAGACAVLNRRTLLQRQCV